MKLLDSGVVVSAANEARWSELDSSIPYVSPDFWRKRPIGGVIYRLGSTGPHVVCSCP
jgi:hypothetical protein